MMEEVIYFARFPYSLITFIMQDTGFDSIHKLKNYLCEILSMKLRMHDKCMELYENFTLISQFKSITGRKEQFLFLLRTSIFFSNTQRKVN